MSPLIFGFGQGPGWFISPCPGKLSARLIRPGAVHVAELLGQALVIEDEPWLPGFPGATKGYGCAIHSGEYECAPKAARLWANHSGRWALFGGTAVAPDASVAAFEFLGGIRPHPSASPCPLAAKMIKLHFSICACHPCAGAMLIFSASFQV